MRGASGALGEELVFRQRAGKTIICLPAPPRLDDPSDEQLAFRERFRLAIRYAKAAIADPDLKAVYQAITEPGNTAYNMAFRDRFKPPVITGIDLSTYTGAPGDTIRVGAADDFRVETVQVAILDAAGAILEQGPALISPEDGGTWAYTATVANAAPAGGKVIATASDLAGNITNQESAL